MDLFDLVNDARLEDLDVVGHRASEGEPDVVGHLVAALVLSELFVVEGQVFEAQKRLTDLDDCSARQAMGDKL